jgi:hypothetical protein
MDREIEKWIEKINKMKGGDVDLSKDEDLSMAIMNLISLEEHFYFTAVKTNDAKYLDMLNSVRQLRKNMLVRIVKNPKGEEWCISKHLLAASMRMIEVGTKELQKNNKKEAEFFFKSAFDMHSLFFAINYGMVDAKKMDKNSSNFKKISSIMKKMLDCCRE